MDAIVTKEVAIIITKETANVARNVPFPTTSSVRPIQLLVVQKTDVFCNQ